MLDEACLEKGSGGGEREREREREKEREKEVGELLGYCLKVDHN